MSNYNVKDLVDVRVSFLDLQKQHFTHNLEGSPVIPPMYHPSIVFENIKLNNKDYLLVGKLQSYYDSKTIMVREVSDGRATILKGEFNNRNDRIPTPEYLREGTTNDSYFFSGEIYLVENGSDIVRRIQNPNNPELNANVLSRSLLKSSLLVSENYISLMNQPFMEYIFKKHVVDNIEYLDINDIKRYNNILSSHVLESTQFIDNAIYRNRDIINQFLDYEGYERVLKEYPKCIYKIKEFILENEHLVNNQNTEGYLKDINELEFQR